MDGESNKAIVNIGVHATLAAFKLSQETHEMIMKDNAEIMKGIEEIKKDIEETKKDSASLHKRLNALTTRVFLMEGMENLNITL